MHPWRVGDRGPVLVGPAGFSLTDELFIHMRKQHPHKKGHFAASARPTLAVRFGQVVELVVPSRIKVIGASIHGTSGVLNFQPPVMAVPVNSPLPAQGSGGGVRITLSVPIWMRRFVTAVTDECPVLSHDG